MSSAPSVEPFKGKDWEECNKFIREIRARALWEGKQRDSAWIADFAAPQFSHKALSWHCRLPEEVQQDWSKLVIALVDRWPLLEDDDESPQIKPTPAAAPSPTRNDNPSRSLQGVLKIVLDDPNRKCYVRFTKIFCDITTEARDAICVRCNFVSGATLLERIDHTSHSWLAIGWSSSAPKIGTGSTDYAYMPWVDPDTLKSSWESGNPLQLVRCNVLPDGEIVPVWTKDDGSKITIVPFVTNSYVYLAADPEAFAKKFSSKKRGRFFIEATD